MNNSPFLPIVSLILAGLLATAVAMTVGPGGAVRSPRCSSEARPAP